jgi:hypothetical protein
MFLNMSSTYILQSTRTGGSAQPRAAVVHK